MSKLYTALFFILSIGAIAQTPCENGMAGSYPCNGVELLSHISAANLMAEEHQQAWINDIWGWTDSMTGKEYAIVGMTNGTSFVDVTDPVNPIFLGMLPEHNSIGKGGERVGLANRVRHDGAKSVWRDIKVYSNHAYIVSEDPGHGVQVFDLTQLRGVTSPQTFPETGIYQGVGKAHNIVINENTGFAYAVGANTFDKTCTEGGLHIISLANPANPVYAGCFDQDGYTHDAQCVIYNGPDAAYQGKEICFNANENSITIVDVNDKNNISMVSRTTYTDSEYAHQGWLTEDHQYLLTNDELDEWRNTTSNTKTLIWDVRDLDAPVLMGSYLHEKKAIDHNLYIKDNLVYESNYTNGLRILDASKVGNTELTELAYFDSYPSSDATIFFGVWSNYPFFESGTIIISDITGGLFILKIKEGIITRQPANKSVCVGEDVIYKMNIAGSGYTYKWQVNDGNGFVDLTAGSEYAGIDTPNLTLNSVSLEQTGTEFRCIVNSGLQDEVITTSATLEVMKQPQVSFDHAIDGRSISFTNNSTDADTYSWQFGNGQTSTDESPTIEYAQSGIYEVSLTASAGNCSNTTTKSIELVITGVDDEINNNLIIHPNPATDRLYISSLTGASQINLIDINGRVVMRHTEAVHAQEIELEVSLLQKGLYYIQADTESGVVTKKVIIK